MDKSKMESTDIRQVEEMLLAQLADIAEKKDKVLLISLLLCYYTLLELTQRLPVLHRIKLYDCAYIVFCYLHLNGQLKRHKEQFDKKCVKDLYQMFKRLYDRLWIHLKWNRRISVRLKRCCWRNWRTSQGKRTRYC